MVFDVMFQSLEIEWDLTVREMLLISKFWNTASEITR